MGRGGRSHLAQRLGALVGLESPLDPSPVLDYLESPAPSAAGTTRREHSHDLVNARAEHHPPLRGSMITVARVMGNLVVQHRTDLSHARGPCRAEAQRISSGDDESSTCGGRTLGQRSLHTPRCAAVLSQTIEY